MNQSALYWITAFLVTVGAAYVQRVTGPTYPLSGKADFADSEISYKFDRSHGGDGDHLVQLEVNTHAINGILEWKRHKTNDPWTHVEMKQRDGVLVAELPHQPPAGKLDYRVMLQRGNESIFLPSAEPVVIRFKGDVPLAILIPHVVIIFAAMLFSNRTGLEYFSKVPNLKPLTYWTLGLFVLGGMILGPVVQYYAFGAFWTGFPFGTDLTDNKVLVSLIAWIAATVALFKSRKPALWVLLAAVILLIVYLIPHSLLGSELDYTKETMR